MNKLNEINVSLFLVDCLIGKSYCGSITCKGQHPPLYSAKWRRYARNSLSLSCNLLHINWTCPPSIFCPKVPRRQISAKYSIASSITVPQNILKLGISIGLDGRFLAIILSSIIDNIIQYYEQKLRFQSKNPEEGYSSY